MATGRVLDAGLLVVALGLSRMFRNDLKQFGAGMLIYDAFYRWACAATKKGMMGPPTG